ncbi:GTP cyclohydrolase II-domain-containing protein [Limtongia smithiae]|uniref:GTP cyclohydrolase II-domain-containing protein n=1 Tax=Limtongia smithiae TaxID=1125753 RepID=UPI0034CEE73D
MVVPSPSTATPAAEFPSFLSPRLDAADTAIIDGQQPSALALALDHTPALPPSIISPAFTPASTVPSTPAPIPVLSNTSSVDTAAGPPSSLPAVLPEVECVVRARIPTTSGTEIFLHLYKNNVDNKEHLAIVFGNSIRSKSLDRVRDDETEMDRMIRGAYVGRLYPGRQTSAADAAAVAALDAPTSTSKTTLVRIHSECYTGETAWSARCDCGEQLDEAARLMGKENHGIVVYLRQEGRGIGLSEKLKAYNLQDLGADTVTANLLLRHPADARSYSLATAILLDLGQKEIRLLTNNPDKIAAVEGKHREIRVVERVPMVPIAWRKDQGGIRSKEVEGYLKTKIERMGHMLDQPM